MGTAQSNQGAQDFFNIGAPGARANGINNMLSGIGNMVLPICIVAGLYIISSKL